MKIKVLLFLLLLSHAALDCQRANENAKSCVLQWKCDVLKRRCERQCPLLPVCILLDLHGDCTQRGWASQS